MTLDEVSQHRRPVAAAPARWNITVPSLAGRSRTTILLPHLRMPPLRRPRVPRLRLTTARGVPAHRAAPSAIPYRRVAQSPVPPRDLAPVTAPPSPAPAPPGQAHPAPATGTAAPVRRAASARRPESANGITAARGNQRLRSADPRLTEVLLLLSLTLSGLLVCGIARVDWAFWLTALTPALIAATGWPRSNDDDEVMRFARLAVVALATLVLGAGPAPTVMLVLIWTLAVAPLYPLLLPHRATVLTISAATIVLSAPVTLRLLTQGYFPPVDLELLAVLVAATPVVAAVSFAVAQAAAPARVDLVGTQRTDPGEDPGRALSRPSSAPLPPEFIAPLTMPDDQHPVDDLWLTQLRADPSSTDSAPESPAGPLGPPESAGTRPADSANPEKDAAADRLTTDTGTRFLGRRRNPDSPWAILPSATVPATEPAPEPDTPPDAPNGAIAATTNTLPNDPNALVTTGELADRITVSTSHSRLLGGTTALFLVELEHRPSTPLPARREAFAQVMRRLRAGVAAQDAVLRVEENTIALLAGGVDTDRCRSMARRLSALIEEPVHTFRGPLVTRCFIGIALADRQPQTPQNLIEAASRALDQARADGPQRWALHDAGPTVLDGRLETELRSTVSDSGIGVLLQPIVTTSTDSDVFRVEALAHWRRADGTPVPAQRFIPLADQIGIGPQLGLNVLDRALEAWTAFRAAGREFPGLSVNISPAQLADPEFPDHLTARLHAHQLPPGALTLEISAAELQDTESTRTRLEDLRSLGPRLSLDHFGRSGISVSGLSELPFHEVKLDRSLVNGLGEDDRLLRSLIDLAHSVNRDVVVLGIENTSQLDTVVKLGADAVQGRLLAHPQPAEDLDTGIITALRRLPGRRESSGTALSSTR